MNSNVDATGAPPLRSAPLRKGPAKGVSLYGHYDAARSMPSPYLISKDGLGDVMSYLTGGEKESLRTEGLFVPVTSASPSLTNCGCSFGCCHPGSWKYESIALLAKHKRIRRTTTQTWRFQPPVAIPVEGRVQRYPTLKVEMTDDFTCLTDAGGDVVWRCIGASYHFIKAFIEDGFDVVVANGVDLATRASHRSKTGEKRRSDLCMLYTELLGSKKECGYDVPYTNEGMGAEFPPALVFEGMSDCASCGTCADKLGHVTDHWKRPFAQRLASAKERIISNECLSVVEAEVGLKLTQVSTNKLFSSRNQDADTVCAAITWKASGFLQRLASYVDFSPSKWFAGCPIYFMETTLKTLHGCKDTALLTSALSLLPHGVFHLTPSCVSRNESYAQVEAAIESLLANLTDANVLACVQESHNHVHANDTAPCTWCTLLKAREEAAAAGVVPPPLANEEE